MSFGIAECFFLSRSDINEQHSSWHEPRETTRDDNICINMRTMSRLGALYRAQNAEMIAGAFQCDLNCMMYYSGITGSRCPDVLAFDNDEARERRRRRSSEHPICPMKWTADPSQIQAGSFIAADEKKAIPYSIVGQNIHIDSINWFINLWLVPSSNIRSAWLVIRSPVRTHDLQSIAQFIIYGVRLFCRNLLYFSSETSTLPHRLKSERARTHICNVHRTIGE